MRVRRSLLSVVEDVVGAGVRPSSSNRRHSCSADVLPPENARLQLRTKLLGERALGEEDKEDEEDEEEVERDIVLSHRRRRKNT
jgi:hypothetical protein